jgi:hypothetical protein
MYFLVIDTRFGTPIHVFLALDPRGAVGYPGFAVREVILEFFPAGPTRGGRRSIGRDPAKLDRFREFASDGAVAVARFILLEPYYVGPTWESYAREYRPQGEKPHKRAERSHPAVKVERG